MEHRYDFRWSTFLSGRTCSIRSKDGRIVEHRGVIATVVTNEEGLAETDKIYPLYAIDTTDAKYEIRETKAPAGFVKDSEAHKIEIAVETDDNVSVTEYTKDGVEWLTQEQYDALADNTGYKSYTYTTEVLKKYTVKVDNQETATYNFTNKGTDAEIVWEEASKPVEKPFDIINTKGVELPSTGGIGTTIFYIIGAILVLGAGVLLVTRRRMSSVN